MYTFIFRFKD
jgi:hypothetical protein